MTALEQRIAIGEACGWKIHRSFMKGHKEKIGLVHLIQPDGNPAHPYPTFGDSGVWGILPDWTNDLNEMREAEKVLNNVQANEYVVQLHRIIFNTVVIPDVCNLVCYFRLLNATAAQRAEAFLRTIGKWTCDDCRLIK